MNLVVFLIAYPISLYAQDFAKIFSRYKPRIAHIETIGELYNGDLERSSGSGILIGFSLVLTNNHVLPPETNYKTVTVNVRLGSRHTDPPLQASAVERDEARDLAIINLKQDASEKSVGGYRCPMPALSSSKFLPPGSEVVVLGYPLNQDLSISGGLVSNQGNPHDPRWQTSTVLNKGNSGGPFFAKNGTFAGIAVGGIVKFQLGDQVVDVDGVNFLIPVHVIRDSPLFLRIEEIKKGRKCWVDHPESIAWFDDTQNSISEETSASTNRDFERSAFYYKGYDEFEINVDHSFSVTKDDHPVVLAPHSRIYSVDFQAEPSHQIERCAWSAMSENQADNILCEVLNDGNLARFSLRLTSGPAYDRWRGWWTGTVSLAQSKKW